MANKESKYAPQLRAMGFAKIPSDVTHTIREVLTKGKNLDYKGLMPTYSPDDRFTFATDETGESWVAVGRKNLSLMGFRDNNTWFAQQTDGKKPN